MKIHFNTVPNNRSEVFTDTLDTFVTGNGHVLAALPYLYTRLVSAAPCELFEVVAQECDAWAIHRVVYDTLQEVPTARYCQMAAILNECGFDITVDLEALWRP